MASDALYYAVKAVNDEYRTALMNRKYYGYRLDRVATWNRVMEIVVALGTSSAIGAWVIWKSTSYGQIAWAVLAGLAVVVAIIKPILNLSKDIERYTRLFIGHGDVSYDLQTIIDDLPRVGDYTTEMDGVFHRARNRIGKLATDDDPAIDEKLRRRCFDEVKREIPADKLWWPN